MKNKIQILIPLMIAVLFVILAGCDKSGESVFVERYVLDGFMPLGQPLRIRLTKSIDIETPYDDNAVGVSGARVVIWEVYNGDTTEHELRADSSAVSGSYVAVNPNAVAQTGYIYLLRIEIGSDVITATTTPAPPAISLDSCYNGLTKVESFADSTDLETYEFRQGNYYTLFSSRDTSAPSVDYFNFFIECMETDWYSNDDRLVSGNNGPSFTNVWPWPTREGEIFPIPPVVLNFQGRHRVRAMTCDSNAFYYLYILFPADADSELPTNVVGALGLFSVYDADTAYFCLTDLDADIHNWCE